MTDRDLTLRQLAMLLKAQTSAEVPYTVRSPPWRRRRQGRDAPERQPRKDYSFPLMTTAGHACK